MKRFVLAFAIGVLLAVVWAALWLVVVIWLTPPVGAQVPQEAERWKREITRQGRMEWGLEAPISTFGAQIETESAYRSDARSGAGAVGIAQFMPATAEWLAGAYSALGPADPLNPVWAIRALARYDLHLYERQPLAATECDRGAFMESAYNGGEAALAREQDACLAVATCDPDRWWGHVEGIHGERADWAWRENRAYPVRIARRERNYVAAEWGRGLCEGMK